MSKSDWKQSSKSDRIRRRSWRRKAKKIPPLSQFADEGGWVSSKIAHVRLSKADSVCARACIGERPFEAHRIAAKETRDFYDLTAGKRARALISFDGVLFLV